MCTSPAILQLLWNVWKGEKALLTLLSSGRAKGLLSGNELLACGDRWAWRCSVGLQVPALLLLRCLSSSFQNRSHRCLPSCVRQFPSALARGRYCWETRIERGRVGNFSCTFCLVCLSNNSRACGCKSCRQPACTGAVSRPRELQHLLAHHWDLVTLLLFLVHENGRGVLSIISVLSHHSLLDSPFFFPVHV